MTAEPTRRARRSAMTSRDELLAVRPEALVEAVQILNAHRDEVVKVMTRYGYTDPMRSAATSIATCTDAASRAGRISPRRRWAAVGRQVGLGRSASRARRAGTGRHSVAMRPATARARRSIPKAPQYGAAARPGRGGRSRPSS